MQSFHPAVRHWFQRRFGNPSAAQARGWPAIAAGEHVLIAAPTGSGKTLAAFLAALDRLFREALSGTLGRETRVLYVSPLKALSNDIGRNLEDPLAGIAAELAAMGHEGVQLTAAVRTGDTSQKARRAIVDKPPHILVTTPESLYLLLTADSGRRTLATVDTVIVDEVHALVGNRRGAHLALSLERLEALVQGPLQRIGLSATQKPMELPACFLVGSRRVDAHGTPQCRMVDEGHLRALDLDLALPDSPLEAVMSNEVWTEIYGRLADLIEAHHTTLVFANTRRLAERVTMHLTDRLGAQAVTSHHGSLSLRTRTRIEHGLKEGSLRAVVATASLELGIDIGHVDLVCQLGSPRAVSTFLQRIGRSGHYHGGVPKGRLFPLTRDELAECTALLHATRLGELDTLTVQPAPVDVLCQQIVAAVACEDWQLDDLYHLCRGAWLYRDLDHPTFTRLVHMLADGYETRRGRRGAYVYYDGVNGVLKARKGARLTAVTNGGAIPDNADYSVLQQPAGTFIGTLNEDFAVESLPGDVFLLGNHSWRILRIETGKVLVEDAAGKPPNIPFWFGEAPTRSEALSAAVSRLREDAEAVLVAERPLEPFLRDTYRLCPAAAAQLAAYLGAGRLALGCLPSRKQLVIERFFDEAGGMQLVVHAPLGARLNRAWGLSLRKRFCRSFNFELQAAATDDAIVLSLGPTHAFPLEDVYGFLNARTVKEVLVQALLDAPMFQTRWRWNATRALAMVRMRGGRRVPPAFQRIDAEDLLAVIFPDQQACLENIAGDREVPDHPLVQQTIDDCLYEYMDLDGLVGLLRAVADGDVATHAVDLPEPSLLAHEILTAKPYAFLDNAPLEERRTQAVYLRRGVDLAQVVGAGFLDAQAIAAVRAEAWPDMQGPDALHEALQLTAALNTTETAAADPHLQAVLAELEAAGRATLLHRGAGQHPVALYIAAETLPRWAALGPLSARTALVPPAREAAEEWVAETALTALVRRRLEVAGPVTAPDIAELFGLPLEDVEVAFLGLETEGVLMRGRFDAALDAARPGVLQWCDRRLLARIHQGTVSRLRAAVQPVSAQAFMRFLCDWQHATPAYQVRGMEGLEAVVAQLEGFEAGAAAWEAALLPTRCHGYLPSLLDHLCLSGHVGWGRVTPMRGKRVGGGPGPIKTTPIGLFFRAAADVWCAGEPEVLELKGYAAQVHEVLQARGALFPAEIAEAARLLPTQVEMGLGELAAAGWAHADSFAGLRAMLVPAAKKPRPVRRAGRRFAVPTHASSGRWSLLRMPPPVEEAGEDWAAEVVAYRAQVLLRRYGVVFRKLLEREPGAPRWRDLLDVYRTMEARGEVRGGRFVDGFSGEQFALPEAVAGLRKRREAPAAPVWVVVCGQDPLNLTGIVTPGSCVARLADNRVLLRDGLPVAALENGVPRLLVGPEQTPAGEAEDLVRRLAVPAGAVPPSIAAGAPFR